MAGWGEPQAWACEQAAAAKPSTRPARSSPHRAPARTQPHKQHNAHLRRLVLPRLQQARQAVHRLWGQVPGRPRAAAPARLPVLRVCIEKELSQGRGRAALQGRVLQLPHRLRQRLARACRWGWGWQRQQGEAWGSETRRGQAWGSQPACPGGCGSLPNATLTPPTAIQSAVPPPAHLRPPGRG